MDAAIAGIVGAAVGAGASIITQFLAGRNQQQLEEQKAERARQDELVKELRCRVADAGQFMLSLIHSADWLTWYARYDPSALTKELLGQYQREVHESMPRLMGTLAFVGSLDPQLHASLLHQASEVSALDGKIGGATANFDSDPDSVHKALSELGLEVVALRNKLSPALVAVMPGPDYRGPQQRKGI